MIHDHSQEGDRLLRIIDGMGGFLFLMRRFYQHYEVRSSLHV